MQTTTERPIIEQLSYTPGGRLPGHDPGYDLFAEDYRAVRRNDGRFTVRRPAKKGGGFYIVNALEHTCNCKGFVQYGHCKHSKYIADLVFLTAGELTEKGQRRQSIELLQAWGTVTAALVTRWQQPVVQAERAQAA